jgi:serine/threonine-protein kinase HipA
MARKLNVYLNNRSVGLLVQDDRGEMIYQYDTSWLADPEAIPLSQSLPLREEPFGRLECRGFFSGILPEGENREVIARNLGITAKNDVKMLEQIGGECAGAITFIPPGAVLAAPGNSYRFLTEPELAEILRQLPRRPLLAGEEHIRFSLAGAQDKLAVYVNDNQIALPLDGSPSTHILKPRIGGLDGIVVNEFLCIRLAKAIGLMTASVTMQSAEEIDYLLVERYDRIRTEDQSLQRLHQEDFCQALGIISEYKYQNEGGPSLLQCFRLLREASALPVIDLGRLLDAVVFNFLIGNYDAHGKNFSLLYTKAGKTSFAPLYDLICTAYYPDLSQKMAMKIGGEYESTKIYLRHFDRLAEEAGLNKPTVRRRIQSLAKSIQAKLPAITPEHVIGKGVATLIHSRCDRALEWFEN